MLGEKQGQRDALPTATLATLRMTRDEVAFRPVPIAGTLSSTAASAVLAAPKVAATGTFAAFRLPKEGLDLEWVPMPSWSVVLLAQHPVLLTVPNCANVPQVVTSAAAKVRAAARVGGGAGAGGSGAALLAPAASPAARRPLATIAQAGCAVLSGRVCRRRMSSSAWRARACCWPTWQERASRCRRTSTTW